MNSFEKLLVAVISRVRPDSRVQNVDPRVVVGWYARFGIGPALRGLIWRWRFRSAAYPVFIGRNVLLAYPRRVRLGRSVSIGANSRVNAFSRRGVSIGDRVTIREGAWIQCSSSPNNPGEELSIGAGTYIGPQVVLGIGGPIAIGDNAQFGVGCVLISENHATDAQGEPSRTEVTRQGIRIGDGCWLGHRVTILDGVDLGPGCIVGAGSVVTKSFPAHTTLVGSPARPVSERVGTQE